MLILKRKPITLNNQYTVSDTSENLIYTARGRYFSRVKNIRLYSIEGKEILRIKKKFFSFMPEYNIYSEDNLIAKVKRKYFYQKYVLLIFNGPTIQIAESVFWSKRFTVYDANEPLIIIQKLLSFTHKYSIDYLPSQSPALATAYAIIIDMIFRKYAR